MIKLMSIKPKKSEIKRMRRIEAIKKAQRKKILTVTVCCIISLIIIGLLSVNLYRQSKARIFTGGGQTVTLFEDGTFTANLAHETRKGTYTESSEGSVLFVSEGIEANGRIVNNDLSLPEEWDDHHGHNATLKLK